MEGVEYVVEHEFSFLPGNTDVVIPVSALPVLNAIQSDPAKRKYKVRAFISSSYNFALSLEEALRYESSTTIRLKDGPQQWHISPYRRAIYFTLEPNESGYLRSVVGYAKAHPPSNALDLFKSAVILLLDRLSSLYQIPLYIQRTELYLENQEHPIVELTFPAFRELVMEYGGGFEMPFCFLSYWSLEREALCSPSSIYRFMSRWRAFESIRPIRRWLRGFARDIGCQEKLPKVPLLTADERDAIRLPAELSDKATTLENLVLCYQDLRNAVAHFWSEGRGKANEGAIVPFRGLDLITCEKASQVLRYCNERMVQDLWDFFVKHLGSQYAIGQTMAAPGWESDFCPCEEALRLYPAPPSGPTLR